MTPLEGIIRELIAAEGPMSVERYMALALGHPVHGYYATRDPFGVAGDFTTAPEISQMFGELVGLWAAEVWSAMGRPDRVRLVELGPGRGTLMSDALRAARVLPGFLEAIDVHLVETSPALRAVQARTMGSAQLRVEWHMRLDEVPPGPAIVLANEFFDALPVRQFVRAQDGWRERLVGLGDDARLVFGLAPEAVRAPPRLSFRTERSGDPEPTTELRSQAVCSGFSPSASPGMTCGGASQNSPQGEKGSPGDVLEIGQAALEIVTELAGRLSTEGGAALIVDYGHIRSGFGDTLQAVRAHAYADPLADPGEADLTAHVDFAALSRAAARAGVAVHGPVPQGAFLRALGIDARAERLKRKAAPETASAVDAALARLTGCGEHGMGALFKAIGLSHPSLRALPGLPFAEPEPARAGELEPAC